MPNDNPFIVKPTFDELVQGEKMLQVAERAYRARYEHAEREAAKPKPPPEKKGFFRKARDIAVEGASHTLPGQIAQLAAGVQLTPETMGTEDLGTVGRGMAGIGGFAADPVTWGSMGLGRLAGGAAMKGAATILGEKGMQKVAESGLKRLALKGATAAPAGATTLAGIEAVKNPFAQLIATGEYSPGEHAKETLKSAALGGAAGAAGALPMVGLPAEVATFAVGEPLLHGEMPDQEDWLNAAMTIGGLRAAGIVTRGMKDVAARTPPKEVAKNILREMDPREGLFVFRAAQHARAQRENAYKYAPPEGTNGRYEPIPVTLTPDGKPAKGTKWAVRDKDADRIDAKQYDNFLDAASSADKVNFTVADQPNLTAKSPLEVAEPGPVGTSAAPRGPTAETPTQAPAPATPPAKPTFRQFVESKGFKLPEGKPTPEQVAQIKAFKAEYDAIGVKPVSTTEQPLKTPQTAQGATQAVPSPTAQGKPVEPLGASGIDKFELSQESAVGQPAPVVPKTKPVTKKAIGQGVKDARSEVQKLYQRHREVIDGEEPGVRDRALSEEANVETALRPGYSFKQGYESQAKELQERLPADLRKNVRVVKKGSPNYQSADGQDVFAGVGTDKMAESIIRYAEQAPGRNNAAALDRTIQFAKSNPEMFTPEEHGVIKNYEQSRVGEGVEPIAAEQLKVGDQFEIQGKPHKVEGISPDTGKVKITDDIDIDLPARGKVFADKGSLREKPASVEFDPFEIEENPFRQEAAIPPRTSETMGEAIALSSPSGKISKRAKQAAEQRLGEKLFGKEGLQRTQPEQPAPAEAAARKAKELRDLAARGMKPKAYAKEAARLEAEAAKPQEIEYFKGDRIQYTGKVTPEGWREFVYLEGAKKGQTGVAPTAEMIAKDRAQRQKEEADMQAGFRRLAESQKKETRQPKQIIEDTVAENLAAAGKSDPVTFTDGTRTLQLWKSKTLAGTRYTIAELKDGKPVGTWTYASRNEAIRSISGATTKQGSAVGSVKMRVKPAGTAEAAPPEAMSDAKWDADNRAAKEKSYNENLPGAANKQTIAEDVATWGAQLGYAPQRIIDDLVRAGRDKADAELAVKFAFERTGKPLKPAMARMEKPKAEVGVPLKTEKGLLNQDIDITKRGAGGKQETLSPKIDEQIADNKAAAKQRELDKEIGQQPLFGDPPPPGGDQMGIKAPFFFKPESMEKSARMLGEQMERAVYRLAKATRLDKVFKFRTPAEKEQYRKDLEIKKRASLRTHGQKAMAAATARTALKEFDQLADTENSLARYRIHQAIVGQYPMERLPEAHRAWAQRARELQDEASREFLGEVVRHFGADTPLARSVAQNIGTYLHEGFAPTVSDKLIAYLPGRLRLKAEQFQRKRDKWRVFVGGKPIIVKGQAEAEALRRGLLSLREQTEAINPFREMLESRKGWVKSKLEEGKVTAQDLKKAIAGKNIRIEKPLTEKQRLDMGFSRDPRFAWGISYSKTAHNTAMLRLSRRLKKLGQEPPTLVAGDAKAEETWAKSEGLEKVTASEKMVGSLHGTYLPKRWARDINEAEKVAQGFAKMWQDYLTMWKVAKVLYNPATHRRNITGNVGFAFLAGMSPWNPANAPHLLKAFTDIKGRGPMYQLLMKNGVIGGEWFGNEVYEKGIEFIRQTPDSPMKTIWHVLNNIHEGAGRLYNLEDQIWKVWHAYKLESQGLKGARLAREVNKHWPNYAGLPRWVKKVSRDWRGTPFVAFNAEAARIYKNAALRHPGRLMLWTLWPTMLTKGTVAYLGISDDEKELIDERRSILRVPGTELELDLQPLLPYRDDRGAVRTIDIRYDIPLGNELLELFEGRPPVMMQPGIVTVQDILYNKDRYTKQQIVSDDDPPSTKFAKYARHFFQETVPAPSWAPTQHGWNRVRDAINGTREDGVLEAFGSALGGINFRRPYSTREEALRRLKTRALLDDRIADLVQRAIGEDLREIPNKRLLRLLERSEETQTLLELWNQSYRSLGGPTARVTDPITSETIAASLKNDVARISLFELRLSHLMQKDVSGDIDPGEKAELQSIREYEPQIVDMMQRMQAAEDDATKAQLIEQFDGLLKRARVQMPDAKHPERELKRLRQRGENPLRDAG